MLPFVRSFYGQPLRYVWENEFGEVHPRREGNREDDLMPSCSPWANMLLWRRSGHDCSPGRGSSLSWTTFTQGDRPLACHLLQRIAQASDPEARVCKGSGVPTEKQWFASWALHWDILITSKHSSEKQWQYIKFFCRAHHLWRISNPRVLSFCLCRGRANYLLRAVRLEMVRGFAEGHNAGLWTCLCNILNVLVDGDRPSSLGGLGLRDAVRTSPPTFWVSWADCIAMFLARHPDVVTIPAETITDLTWCRFIVFQLI